MYENGDEMKLEGFPNGNEAQEQPDLKSISGFCFLMAGRTVSWKHKKQTVVAKKFKTSGIYCSGFVSSGTVVVSEIWRHIKSGT